MSSDKPVPHPVEKQPIEHPKDGAQNAALADHVAQTFKPGSRPEFTKGAQTAGDSLPGATADKNGFTFGAVGDVKPPAGDMPPPQPGAVGSVGDHRPGDVGTPQPGALGTVGDHRSPVGDLRTPPPVATDTVGDYRSTAGGYSPMGVQPDYFQPGYSKAGDSGTPQPGAPGTVGDASRGAGKGAGDASSNGAVVYNSDGSSTKTNVNSDGVRTTDRFDANGVKTNTETKTKDGQTIESNYDKAGTHTRVYNKQGELTNTELRRPDHTSETGVVTGKNEFVRRFNAKGDFVSSGVRPVE